MTDEEISKSIDDIAHALHGQGMEPLEVKIYLREQADRVANELMNEPNDYSR
jgi:hypothetical protein